MIKLIYPKFWQNKSWQSNILIPLTYVYILFSKIRNFFIKTTKLPNFVICVGNTTVGGTGKTQFVIWLTNLFKERNIDYLIVSKSYKSKLKSFVFVNENTDADLIGDEAKELSLFGNVIVTKKLKYIIPILKQVKNNKVIILDDGLQNNILHKDLSILMIDGIRKFGNNRILPAGPLRYNYKKIISTADIAIIVNNKHNNELSIPTYFANIKPLNKLDINNNYIAFAGIGNTDRFFDTLIANNLNLVYKKTFPDHHSYNSKDIEFLRKQAKKLNATLVTTRKDYVKLKAKLDIKVLHVELEIESSSKLINFIYEKIKH